MAVLLEYLSFYRRIIILIIVPVAPIPLLRYEEQACKCAYIILVMAACWVTQVIPIAATALLPLVMLPVMGLQPSGVVAGNYMKDSIILLLAGMLIAAAVEEWNLHKRIALRLILLCGPQPKWLVLGCMLPSWILSMLIPNTSTVIIMMPIIDEVIQLLKPRDEEHIDHKLLNEEIVGTDASGEIRLKVTASTARSHEDIRWRSLCRAVSLGAVYASSIGGSAVLTGTGTNVVLKVYLDDLYLKRSGEESPLTYGTWAAMAIPYSVLLLLCAWGLLLTVFLRKVEYLCTRDHEGERTIKDALRKKLGELGSISFAEGEIISLLLVLSLAWFLRRPGFFPGWSVWFKGGYVSGTTMGLIIGSLTFILPSSLGNFRNVRTGTQYKTLLTWKSFERRVPWGVVILIGGGFAIARASEDTGLSRLVGERLLILSSVPSWLILLVATMLVSVVTELTTNVAVTTLSVPILTELATRLGLHPLYFAFPCTLASCNAFLLPVATPPNAIGYAYNHYTTWDMLKVGAWLNLTGIALINLTANLIGNAVFHFSDVHFSQETIPNITSYTTVRT